MVRDFVFSAIEQHKTFPLLSQIEVGNNLDISCQSSSVPRWFQMSADNSISELPEGQYNLNIEKAKLEHNGIYYCYGSSSQKPKVFIAKSIVKVYG